MTDGAKRRMSQIRDALRQNHDGLTKRELQTLVPGWTDKTIESDLLSMPDAYIDRWQESKSRHKYVAVWCVVVPPANCPKPSE